MEVLCEIIKYRIGSWWWGDDHEEYFINGYGIIQYQDVLFRLDLDSNDNWWNGIASKIRRAGIGGTIGIDLDDPDIEPYMTNEEIIRDGGDVYDDWI